LSIAKLYSDGGGG